MVLISAIAPKNISGRRWFVIDNFFTISHMCQHFRVNFYCLWWTWHLASCFYCCNFLTWFNNILAGNDLFTALSSVNCILWSVHLVVKHHWFFIFFDTDDSLWFLYFISTYSGTPKYWIHHILIITLVNVHMFIWDFTSIIVLNFFVEIWQDKLKNASWYCYIEQYKIITLCKSIG